MRALTNTIALTLFVFLLNPVAADEDILVMDDFETGTAAPKGWTKGNKIPGVTYKYDKQVGKSGKRSLSLQKTAQRFIPIAQWTRKLKYKSDKNALTVSAQVRAEGVTKAIIDVIFLDKENEWISHQWVSYIGQKNQNDSPADHDWKEYSGTVAIPDGTYRIQLALQIYGPGKVWFDDLKAAYAESNESDDPLSIAYDNMMEVKVGESTGNYLYVEPPNPAASGNGLLIVLPGGDGSADFHPFVKNIHANSTGKDFALAQPIAKNWTPKQVIVWPTSGSKVKKMGYTTEELIESVIRDVGTKTKLDPKRIYVLAWSSGGPAAYAALLQKDSALTGGILAMSVFKPDQLPKLANGKDRRFYILHSKADRVCPYWMAKNAADSFSDAGVTSKLVEYAGGHGWHGDVFGNIRNGVDWLEK